MTNFVANLAARGAGVSPKLTLRPAPSLAFDPGTKSRDPEPAEREMVEPEPAGPRGIQPAPPVTAAPPITHHAGPGRTEPVGDLPPSDPPGKESAAAARAAGVVAPEAPSAAPRYPTGEAIDAKAIETAVAPRPPSMEHQVADAVIVPRPRTLEQVTSLPSTAPRRRADRAPAVPGVPRSSSPAPGVEPGAQGHWVTPLPRARFGNGSDVPTPASSKPRDRRAPSPPPAEPVRERSVQVRIGRVEIRATPPPVPARSLPRQGPRGFDDLRLARVYLDRSHY